MTNFIDIFSCLYRQYDTYLENQYEDQWENKVGSGGGFSHRFSTIFSGSGPVDSEVVDSEYHDAVINNTFFLFPTKINVYFVFFMVNDN